MATPEIATKRIYEPAADEDGFRVLVDRLWPRGVSKEKAALNLWARDLAPSDGLRKWFRHDPSRWAEFEERYRAELAGREEALKELVETAGDRPMTLLYSARDEKRNQALVLKDVLEAL